MLDGANTHRAIPEMFLLPGSATAIIGGMCLFFSFKKINSQTAADRSGHATII
jgi:hypothetical protein